MIWERACGVLFFYFLRGEANELCDLTVLGKVVKQLVACIVILCVCSQKRKILLCNSFVLRSLLSFFFLMKKVSIDTLKL